MHHTNSGEVSKELWALANGPQSYLTKFYSGCIVNEVRFHTQDRDDLRTTQNSGLLVVGEHQNILVEFYGVLSRVIELTYLHGYKVVLFWCEWFDTGGKKTMHKDKYFLSIDTTCRWCEDDPFVLPNQVQQVFYVDDTKLGDPWKIAQLVCHRHLWDIEEHVDLEGEKMNDNIVQQHESSETELIYATEDQNLQFLGRDDIEPDIINIDVLTRIHEEEEINNIVDGD